MVLAVLLVACSAGSSEPAADAAPDASPPDPLPHCSPAAPLPDWATASGAELDADCGVRVTGYADGVARLRYGAPARPSFAVIHEPAPPELVRAAGTADGAELCTAELRIAVADTCAVTVYDAAGRVLVADAAPPAAGVLTRATPPGERFYGFGEKTGPLDKRGRRMTFWNTDAYDPALGGYAPEQDPLYLSIPWLIGLRDGVAYGVLTDDPGLVVLDVAASAPERYTVEVAAGAIDQYVVAGPRIAEIVRRYGALTGRMPLPPRWALGYHQSRWGYTPAARLDELADRFRAEAIPADALWLDIQHMDGFRTFTWDPVSFGDPEGLAARLAARGFRLVAIADPGIKIDPAYGVYAGGLAGDHFLRTPEGAVYEGVVWPGPSAFPDFTAAVTRAWWAEHVAAQGARGVAGVWLDVNEPTIFPESEGVAFPGDLPVDGDGFGGTIADVHNAYALAEARATYDGLRAAAPERRPFILSRAGYAGIQRYAAVWTGDVVSDWDGLRGTLPMLLGMGLSGVALSGSDVGGYSGHATPELFARWMALGAVSPLFRGHVTSGVPGQEPWEHGTEVRDISRVLIGERYRLLPYWYSLAREASVTGAPMLRPMVYEFQDDPATWELDDQAMLGPFLLVAPVLEPGATARTVYLPAGRWFEYHSGAIYDGPATVEVDATLAAAPTFVRAGAIVPRGPLVQHTGEAPLAPLSLDLYPGDAASTFALYEDAGDGYGAASVVEYTLVPEPDGARLVIGARAGDYQPPPRDLHVRVRRVDHVPAAVTVDGFPVEWSYEADDRSVTAIVPDATATELRFVYDPAIAAPRPDVAVLVEVQVPAGTPPDATIYVASSANGWTQQPLAWTEQPGLARGYLTVPRGRWFFYKYTRGDWDTVEKWPGCEEAADRYRFGAAPLAQRDTVWQWRDACI